jgi:anti-sigma B factor antagonist
MTSRLCIEPGQGMPSNGTRYEAVAGILTGRMTDDDTVILRLRGELDYANSATLQRWLDSWGVQTPKHLVLDVSELSFCDSAGLSVLISAYRRLTSQGGDVTLRGVRASLRRVVSITGLDSLFTIEAAG